MDGDILKDATMRVWDRDILRVWDITLSQLMSTSWCVIVRFEIIFHEFQEILGTDHPTLPVFDHYFNLVIANHD
jgi:hypothetical protein